MAVLNLDIAQRLDIICRKGDTFEFSFDIGDEDLAQVGTWTMQVRPTEDDDDGNPLLQTTSSVTGSVITLTIPATTGTYNMAGIDAGLYVYDVELYDSDNGSRKTYLYGTFKVNDDITFQ
jgi:hypothetical protein